MLLFKSVHSGCSARHSVERSLSFCVHSLSFRYYAAYFPYNLYHQVDWTICCRKPLEIDFVSHLGDIVEHENRFEIEWLRANETLNRLLNADMPHGMAVGNHDGVIKSSEAALIPGFVPRFDKSFPTGNYEDREWFGGSFPKGSMRNNYQIVKREGYGEVLVLHVSYNSGSEAEERRWIRSVLSNNTDKFTVLVSHSSGSDCFPWIDGWVSDLMYGFCQIKVALGGHTFACGGENAIPMTNRCGGTSWSLISDYQMRTQGGDATVRIYRFHATDGVSRSKRSETGDAYDRLCTYTYSIKNDLFETDDNSYFSVGFDNAISARGCPSLKSCTSTFTPPVMGILTITLNAFVLVLTAYALSK
jgi:hypothetical protein